MAVESTHCVAPTYNEPVVTEAPVMNTLVESIVSPLETVVDDKTNLWSPTLHCN
jgi:hypothetical protein